MHAETVDVVVGIALGISEIVLAQEPQPGHFEVVSIKRNTSNATGGSVGSTPDGSFHLNNGAIRSFIANLSPIDVHGQIENLPSWVLDERYDINTKAPAGSTRQQEGEMLRNLLVERFKASGHVEQREQTMFALVVARSDGRLGPQMKKATVDCTARVDPSAPPESDPAKRCGVSMGTFGWATAGTTMDVFVRNMGTLPGGIVVNKTGLDGFYALTLQFARPGAQPNADNPGDLPEFGTALQEQLGLKLVPEKTLQPVFVLDHIERPTDD